jgi:hypothetical protein
MAALAVKDEYQGLAAAVSLGITVLKRCKQNTWAELTEAMSREDPVVVKAFGVLDLSDDQLELIGAHQPELGLLRIAPAATHVICPACGTFILSSDTAPTRCLVTPGCSGKPAKISAAVNAKKPAEEPAQEAEEKPSAAAAAEPGDAPELEELKANLDAAVETVHALIGNVVAEAAANETAREPEAKVAKPAPVNIMDIDLDDDFD